MAKQKKKITVSICMSKEFEIEADENSNLRYEFTRQHYLPTVILEECVPPAGIPRDEAKNWIIDNIDVI